MPTTCGHDVHRNALVEQDGLVTAAKVMEAQRVEPARSGLPAELPRHRMCMRSRSIIQATNDCDPMIASSSWSGVMSAVEETALSVCDFCRRVTDDASEGNAP